MSHASLTLLPSLGGKGVYGRSSAEAILPCRYCAGGGNAEEQPHRLPVHIMLTFGACSGLIAQTATYPLDVVRRQMQVEALQFLGNMLRNFVRQYTQPSCAQPSIRQ